MKYSIQEFTLSNPLPNECSLRYVLCNHNVEIPKVEDIDLYSKETLDQIMTSYSPSQIRNLLDVRDREELAQFFFQRLIIFRRITKPYQKLDMDDIDWSKIFTYLRKSIEAVYRV